MTHDHTCADCKPCELPYCEDAICVTMNPDGWLDPIQVKHRYNVEKLKIPSAF